MTVQWTMEDYWAGQPQTEKYLYTGGVQTFVVPDTVTSVYLQVRGGSGGASGAAGDIGSVGGHVSGWLAVSPGDVLNIYVGGEGGIHNGALGGAGGFNGGAAGSRSGALGAPGASVGGGGGGGASDVRLNGTALTDRVAVGGGGGGSTSKGRGGYGGGNDVAVPRGFTLQGTAFSLTGIEGGHAGSQTAGGAYGHAAVGTHGTNGALGVGGTGATITTPGNAPGGGGGGYYGGGGGGNSGTTVLCLGFGGGAGSNYDGGFDPTRPSSSSAGRPTTVRVFALVTVLYQAEAPVYALEINPNDGGSPQVQKQIAQAQNVGPNRNAILQEGLNQTPVISFSGVILTQGHLENLEYWYDRRVFIKLIDDLGREFYGVFSQFNPKRSRRANNFWYHTYDAQFTVSAYKNASGNWVYGRVD